VDIRRTTEQPVLRVDDLFRDGHHDILEWHVPRQFNQGEVQVIGLRPHGLRHMLQVAANGQHQAGQSLLV